MNRITNILKNIFIRKNLSNLLVIINISIFLSIFAATAAIVSIFIEIEISEKELEIQADSDLLDDLKILGSEYPLYRTIIDTVYASDLALNRKYTIFESIEKFDILLDYRQFYYDRAISMHRYIDNFYLDWSNDMTEFMEDIRNFYEPYIETDPELANTMRELIDEYRSQFIKLEYEYDSYDIEINSIEIPTASEVYSEDMDYDFYYNLHDLAVERHHNLEDLMYIVEASTSDIISVIENSLSNQQEEVRKLSNYEVWIIFVAFIIQVAVFLIIQLFEIGAINRERSK
tara:strand:- start:1112 stop:1975 length:864 start_codon:yes stop_codon:yes gene_type:complete